MKRGLGVNKEVLLCDLESARTSIQSTVIGITPSNIKTLREKYTKHLEKYTKFKYASSYSIDVNGMAVIDSDTVVLKENVKPIA